MKKIFAVLLGMALLAVLCVSVSARGLDYKAYPLFDSEGKMTDGVEFYVCGEEIDYDWIVSRIGKGYPDNCIGETEEANLPAKLIIWSLNVNHLTFGTGIRIVDGTVVKITFTGRGFRLISNYAEGYFPAPIVTVDGEEIECSLDEVDVASETIIAEKEGLEWGTHTVVITGTGDCEFDSFEVAGFPGIYDGPEPTQEEETEPDTAEPDTSADKQTEPKATDGDKQTEPKAGTDKSVETGTPADKGSSSSPVNVGLIIGIVAAIVVVAAVVIIIAKKKK